MQSNVNSIDLAIFYCMRVSDCAVPIQLVTGCHNPINYHHYHYHYAKNPYLRACVSFVCRYVAPLVSVITTLYYVAIIFHRRV